jgi:leucyl/phenylalanyl-tRNA--protein transferase
VGAAVTVFRLGRALTFPDPRLSEPDGLLAVGGDLEPDRLLLAYRLGIFPWYGPNNPRLWWSPDPRMVLPCEALHVPRSLAKRTRRGDYRVTVDAAFGDVVERCAKAPRPGQDGTWIVPEMRRAYVKLHELGYAHSFEAWDGDALVGGLYGVAVGDLFCGESMFAAPDSVDTSSLGRMAFGHVLQPHDPAHVGSSLRGSDDESEVAGSNALGTDPRKPEVVRTSRFNAEDAEFGQEDAEELSGVLTAYPCHVIRTWPGPAEREPAMGARRAAIKVPASEAGRPTTSVRDIYVRS